MSKSEYEQATRLLVLARGASEAEDARDRDASAPLPVVLSDTEMDGMDDASDFALETVGATS